MVDITPAASYSPTNTVLQVKNASNHTAMDQSANSLTIANKTANRNFTDNTTETRDQTHQMLNAGQRDVIWNEIAPHMAHFQANIIPDLNNVQARAEETWDRAFNKLLPNLTAQVAAQIEDARREVCEKLCQQYSAWVRTAGSSRNSWVQETWANAMVKFERQIADLAAKLSIANIQHETQAVSDAYAKMQNAYITSEAQMHSAITQDLALLKGAWDKIDYTVQRDQIHSETLTELAITGATSFTVQESASDTTDNAGRYTGDVGTISEQTAGMPAM